MKNLFVVFLILITAIFVFNACGQESSPTSINSKVPSHVLWDSLLHQYVDNSGLVGYHELRKDSVLLRSYLCQLENSVPGKNWSTNDQLAYWINLYNAATIDLVLRHYPIESIKDIGAAIQIPFINTPWQIKFIHINDKLYNLDHIEHNIIRKKFDEPRIHFALVCAAKSCPKLRNEAYTGDELESQLSDQVRAFLSDSSKNKMSPDEITISKLFRWYGGDFKKEGSLIDYINQYSPELIDENADVNYMDYYWELNDQRNMNSLIHSK